MKFLFPMVFIAIAQSTFAQEGFIPGNELHSWCVSKSATDEAACATFILGTLEGATIEWGRLNPGARDSTTGPFCLPKGVVRGQAIDVVKAYLNEQPALRHFPASSLALTSVGRAFPCK